MIHIDPHGVAEKPRPPNNLQNPRIFHAIKEKMKIIK